MFVQSIKEFNKEGTKLYLDELKQWLLSGKNGKEPDLDDFTALNEDLSIRKRGWLLVDGPYYKLFPTQKEAKAELATILAFNIRTF